MDIKLKNADFSLFKKSIAIFILVLCFGLSASIFMSIVKNTDGLEPLLEPQYVNTNELFTYQQNFYIGLNNLLKYKNEENIKQGNTINKEEFENRKKEIFNEWFDRINQTYNGYLFNRGNIYFQLKDKFEEENIDKINELYNSMVNYELINYYSLLQRVNNKEGLYYYASDGHNVYTNCSQADQEYYKSLKAYYLFDKNGFKYSPNENDKNSRSYFFQPNTNLLDNKIYIGVSDQYISKKQAEWGNQRIYLKNGIEIISGASLIILLCLMYLIWKSGRSTKDNNISLNWIDKFYTDISAVISFAIIIAWTAVQIEVFRQRFLNYMIIDLKSIQPDFWGAVLFNALCAGLTLIFLLSLIRHLKNKTIIKHSILYLILSKVIYIINIVLKRISSAVRLIIKLSPLSFKITGFILIIEILIFVLSALIFSSNSGGAVFWLFILCILTVIGIYIILVKLKPFGEILKGVEEIKNGNLEYAISVQGDNVLARLAKDINTIADGLKKAVEKEIKSERMKTDLITNVSHDLKTPLTSIINYVDLLSKEKLQPETANEYVAVIKQKSEKLKLLTQDLFEISKAQSGNITVDIEKINVSLLIRQCIAEFEEQMSSAGLDFKVNIQNPDTFIMADGKRLFRVFENLIGNILKYSLANTRVYINIYNNNNNVMVELKNIANYEMNFKEDEILERFVRGDNARTSDGSGLGLAIAESYITACGGKLQINIDGDLFKAVIKFAEA